MMMSFEEMSILNLLCPLQQRSQLKILGGAKNLEWPKCLILGKWHYFCLGYRLSKHRMTICSENLGVAWPP